MGGAELGAAIFSVVADIIADEEVGAFFPFSRSFFNRCLPRRLSRLFHLQLLFRPLPCCSPSSFAARSFAVRTTTQLLGSKRGLHAMAAVTGSRKDYPPARGTETTQRGQGSSRPCVLVSPQNLYSQTFSPAATLAGLGRTLRQTVGKRRQLP